MKSVSTHWLNVAARRLEDGLIVRALPVGHVIAISPPLCITPGEVYRFVDGLACGVRDVADELVREGFWRARPETGGPAGHGPRSVLRYGPPWIGRTGGKTNDEGGTG